ncbi:putative growth/differentiation factor 11 [Penaeus vannamei]|uniref:Putative growth/differentiation factor 11 n=1 Tax=Penaeus vannamei TaxID=6689 RepID=A0A3R7PQX8_PENVA|nr:putative growth/differentiation factor 11 [Penaeus vannamei]
MSRSRIISFNAEGLSSVTADLLGTLRADVLCLQETHISSTPMNIQVPFMAVPFTSEIHPPQGISAISRRMGLKSFKLTVTSVYKPPAAPFAWPGNQNLRAGNTEHLGIGDFNSHNAIWGYNHNNKGGEEVELWALNQDLTLLHDAKRKPSFLSARWRRGYNPDLAFVTSRHSNNFEKSVLDPVPRSQHRPIAEPSMEICNSEYTQKLQKTVNPCLTEQSILHSEYQQAHESDRFAESAIEIGETLLNQISIDKRDRWQDMTHNSKTQVCTFHLNTRQANRNLRVRWENKELKNTKYPVHLAVALCFSTAEYCAPVWARSCHASAVDTELNQACRIITRNLKSTPLPAVHRMASIAPPAIRRDALTKQERDKQLNDCRHPLYAINRSTKLKSRKSFGTNLGLEGRSPAQHRLEQWELWDRSASYASVPPPSESLPNGSSFKRNEWVALNRARAKGNEWSWRLKDKQVAIHGLLAGHRVYLQELLSKERRSSHTHTHSLITLIPSLCPPQREQHSRDRSYRHGPSSLSQIFRTARHSPLGANHDVGFSSRLSEPITTPDSRPASQAANHDAEFSSRFAMTQRRLRLAESARTPMEKLMACSATDEFENPATDRRVREGDPATDRRVRERDPATDRRVRERDPATDRRVRERDPATDRRVRERDPATDRRVRERDPATDRRVRERDFENETQQQTDEFENETQQQTDEFENETQQQTDEFEKETQQQTDELEKETHQ